MATSLSTLTEQICHRTFGRDATLSRANHLCVHVAERLAQYAVWRAPRRGGVPSLQLVPTYVADHN